VDPAVVDRVDEAGAAVVDDDWESVIQKIYHLKYVSYVI
jgi:H2-forming N5,N10-methylenetetrahydromethanopterin dehydrogenase-like enzyme